jgi:SnoaL-like domain
MSESPIDELLRALDRLDSDAAMALMAPGIRLLTADGRHAEGKKAVGELIASFLATLRSTSHRVTAQWHQDNVWIAEVEATYELKDRMRTGVLPRVFVLRMGPDGFADLRAYGAREHQLTDHHPGEEGMLLGGRWMPPL